MLYTILDNVIIILLTILGLPQSISPVSLILMAAALMIRTTSRSFSEETTKLMMFVEIVMLLSFSLLSGGFTGFLVFFLQRDLKEYVRILAGTILLCNESRHICCHVHITYIDSAGLISVSYRYI